VPLIAVNVSQSAGRPQVAKRNYGTDGCGMAPVSSRISSKVRLPAVEVLAPTCTESAWVLNVCVVLLANAVVN